MMDLAMVVEGAMEAMGPDRVEDMGVMQEEVVGVGAMVVEVDRNIRPMNERRSEQDVQLNMIRPGQSMIGAANQDDPLIIK